MSVQATCTRGSLKCSSASQSQKFRNIEDTGTEFEVPLTLQKKLGPDWSKSGQDQFFLTVYTGNNQVRLMIEKHNSTHAQNHRKAWQAQMKKIVRNKDAFTQCFQTAKGVRTHFFFGFGAIGGYDFPIWMLFYDYKGWLKSLSKS